MSYSVAMNLRRVSSTNINQMLNVLRVSLLSMKASITTVYSDKHQRAIRYIKHEMTLRLAAAGCRQQPYCQITTVTRLSGTPNGSPTQQQRQTRLSYRVDRTLDSNGQN